MKQVIFILVFVFAMFAVPLHADIPPDPGFKRVDVSMTIELQENIPDYRLFVITGDRVEELHLKKGESKTLYPSGGGARYGAGNVYAIPSISLKPDESPNESNVRSLAGVIPLLTHYFRKTVHDSETRGSGDVRYRIERRTDGPIAVQVNDIDNSGSDIDASNNRTNQNGVSFGITNINRSVTPFGLITIAGGVLITLTIVIAGIIWFVRKGPLK